MLAIAGGKGGSGKTTTALGLAATLARQGEKPVVVDCDCDMPDLHLSADVKRTDGIDKLAEGAPIEAASVSWKERPTVRLLTAGSRKNVDSALHRLPRWEGPVLLDCPPGTGPDAVRPLRHADETLLVTTDQPQSVADTKLTAGCARQLDSSIIGTLVRNNSTRACGQEPETPSRQMETLPRQIRIPTENDPLSHPAIRAVWSKISRQIRQSRHCS